MRLPAGFRFGFVALAVSAAAPSLVAQAPPPAPLPPSVTGQVPPPTVQPVSLAAPAGPAAPIGRFTDLRTQPPETVQAIFAMRTGADWLWRMNQPNGRFVAGVNPALKQSLPDDHDFRQAVATFALCRAARFTGDERFTARAAQSVLALLSLTRPDPADPACRIPTISPDRGNRVGFAATLVLAIAALPTADPKLAADADALTGFVRKQCGPDGSVRVFETTEAAAADPEAANTVPGLALQALVVGLRAKPDAATQAAVARGIGYYRAACKSQPHPVLAATLLPAVTDYFLLTKDPTAAAAGFELADALCGFQYTRADARQAAWAGGFRTVASAALGAEPTADAALCAHGLAAATTLTRNAPDLNRFGRYRQACVEAVLFTRGLQFSPDNTDHFEPMFRNRFLTGGVHLGPTSGTVRADSTAQCVLACVRYLESGAEARD